MKKNTAPSPFPTGGCCVSKIRAAIGVRVKCQYMNRVADRSIDSIVQRILDLETTQVIGMMERELTPSAIEDSLNPLWSNID